MDGDIITFLENDVHVGDMLYIPGQPPGRIDGNIRVVSVYLHSQMGGCVGNLRPDGAQADNAQLLALNLAASKCLLLFSVSLVMLSSSALALHHSIPPTISRDAMSMPAITSSFTPLALAPGVLNTTMPLLGAGVQRNIVDTCSPHGPLPAGSQEVPYHAWKRCAPGRRQHQLPCLSSHIRPETALCRTLQWGSSNEFFHNNPTLLLYVQRLLFPVLLLEVSHKFHQFPNTLRRHCIVNAGAHAAHGSVSFQILKARCL